jgi:hypothetical protein
MSAKPGHVPSKKPRDRACAAPRDQQEKAGSRQDGTDHDSLSYGAWQREHESA